MILALLLALSQDKAWSPDESVALAKKALKEDSKVEDWRPGLKAQVDRYLKAIEQEASLEGLRFVLKSVKEDFDDAYDVARKAPAKVERLALVESAAKGGRAKGALLVCESAEFDEVHDSVVICLGDVKAKKIRKSLVLATGKVTAEECEDCVVYSGGDLACSRRIKHGTLLSLGKIESAEADDVVFINPGERKIDRSTDTRDVELPKLPKRK